MSLVTINFDRKKQHLWLSDNCSWSLLRKREHKKEGKKILFRGLSGCICLQRKAKRTWESWKSIRNIIVNLVVVQVTVSSHSQWWRIVTFTARIQWPNWGMLSTRATSCRIMPPTFKIPGTYKVSYVNTNASNYFLYFFFCASWWGGWNGWVFIRG